MLIFSFALATLLFCLQGVAWLPFSLTSYAPWIALFILSHPKDIFKTMAASCAIGIFIDLFADTPLGLYAVSYTLTAALLSRFRNHFLYERPLHLSLFTLFFSLIASFLQLFFFFLFDRRISIGGQWILLDRLGSSLFDGIYALVWHSGPLFLWSKALRKWALFWLKKNHSRT